MTDQNSIMDSAEQFVRAKYAFFDESPLLFEALISKIRQYDQTSCGILENLFRAGMKTVDSMQTQHDCQAVSVQILLSRFYDMCHAAYVAFAQAEATTAGSSSVTFTSDAFAVLTQFENWDIGLQGNPFRDIGRAYTQLLEGVSA